MIRHLKRYPFSLPTQATALRLLMRPARVTREEIIALQNKRLRRIITYAYEKVPYYRRLFDKYKLKPHDIRSPADLSAIPVTTKEVFQSKSDDMIARDVNPELLVAHKTGGYSGQPTTIKRSWLEERVLSLFRLRNMYYYGLKKTDKIVSITQYRPAHPRDNQLPMKILQALRFFRSTFIDVSQKPADIVQQLHRISPDVLTGYATLITKVAETINAENLPAFRPRFVMTGAEILTPPMREQIGKAFCAPVYNAYGSYEFGTIAWQCRENDELHTCDDSVIIEVLKDGRPVKEGEQGEVVATGLYSCAMPFIRYRLGDIVTKGFETCPCGLPFATISGIQGRMIDYFPLPGDRLIHPYTILRFLHQSYSWIRQFQLVQERMDLIVLKLVTSGNIPSEQLAQFKDSVSALLGEEIEFKINFVPEIQMDKSGKFRPFIPFMGSFYD